MADNKIELVQKESKLVQKELISDLRTAWNNWIYSKKQVQFLEEQASLLRKSMQKAEEMIEKGESGKLETLSLSGQLMSIENELIKGRKYLNENRRALKQLCFCDELPEKSSTYSRYYWSNLLDSLKLDPAFNKRNEQQLLMANSSIKVGKAQYFPQAYLGYVNQSLNNVTGFQSFQIGLSIPIIYNGVKGQVEELKIEKNIQESTLSWEYKLKNQRLESAKNDYKNYNELLEKSEVMMDQLTNYQASTSEALELGELNFYEFVQNLTALFNIQKTNIELQKEIANISIELQYLTATK